MSHPPKNRRASRLLSGFLAALMLSLLAVPVCAADKDYVSGDTFWNWIAGSNGFVQKLVGYELVGLSFGRVCAKSPDTYHHASSYTTTGKKGRYNCVCDYCGHDFTAYETDLEQSFTQGGSYGGGAGRKDVYDKYVESLPSPGYSSMGKLVWQPSIDDVVNIYWAGFYDSFREYSPTGGPEWIKRFADKSGYCLYHPVFAPRTIERGYGFSFKVKLPFSGEYSFRWCRLAVGQIEYSDGSKVSCYSDFKSTASLGHRDAGSTYRFLSTRFFESEFTNGEVVGFVIDYFLPSFEVVPDDAFENSVYDSSTRPTGIIGGNYGVVGDNNQITQIENNSPIVNETDNTYLNPATGQTESITNWSYDYSDRSYTLTLESGDTVTVTYGDENISITENNIDNSSGDTIVNNYTIYYIIDGSGSEAPPTACVHDWQEASAVPASCAASGSKTLTCSKCQQTKTETVPALGHDWKVKRTVTTQYDDTGQLVQEGYILYECSRCQEQYKSIGGALPPEGGSGTAPGGDESIWDKLGSLLGSVINGILSLLSSLIDTVLGGLIDLVTGLFETLSKLVDLFGSVGEAFQILWTWLPPEIMAILVAGVSIFVFIALLKFFSK